MSEKRPCDDATELARERVRVMLLKAGVPSGRTAVGSYIDASARGNLICLDCGSENHTRGSDWCNGVGGVMGAGSPEGGAT